MLRIMWGKTISAAIAAAIFVAPVVNASPGSDNAARSARQYLQVYGFSRSGLINQLVSFDQYSAADATSAVDGLGIDWNAQAVRSAKQYLQLQGFSHSGLVGQLTQFDGYTSSQAEYGATGAGV